MAESFFAALLAGRAEAQRFLAGNFRDPRAWRAAADAASTRVVAPRLLETFAQQAAGLPRCDARARNLDRLARPGTTVVVTGQQLGLFGGPLYTLHKAATAIARARMLEELSGRPCVPLFWLQTEDHDYAEVATVAIAGPNGPVEFGLPEAQASRVAIAHRVLPPAIEPLLERVGEALAARPHGEAVMALLRTHYIAGRAWTDAFKGLLAELFQGHGLVMLDPRVPEVAQLGAGVMRRALTEQAPIAEQLAARAAALGQVGFEEQVHTRSDAALVFFHPEGASGPRYRLVARGAEVETPAGRLPLPELLAWLARDPLCFSSSALLRPLVQDALLPTAAYVGGPAELAYFAQLPDLYARYGLHMPLIAPRARLRLIDPTTRSLLERLKLCAADCECTRDQLLERTASRQEGAPARGELRARWLDALDRELEAVRALGEASLADPIRRTRDTCANALGKLADKAERVLLERDAVASERIDRVLAALRPGGVPQERAYGFFGLAASVGHERLIAAIVEAAAPLDPAVRDVFL